MKNLTEKLINTLDEYEKDLRKEPNYLDLLKAAEEYNKMIKLGIIKKKGYGLIGIDQINIKTPSFNSK